MADISKIQIEGVNYDIKDEISRQKVNKVAYNNIYVGTFFDATALKVHFVTSLDGKNWSEFNKNVNITGVRDPQLTYNPNNKTFYLCVTKGEPGVNTVIFTSTDFINWERHNIALGYNTACWAPELFFDDENVYFTISVGELGAMQIHLLDCDIDNLTFSNDRILSLGIADAIDSSIIKYNGVYYLTVKNNTTSKQLIYSSNNLINFSVVNNDVLNMDVECEGGQLLNVNDMWLFYGDTWYNYGNYCYMQTDDITNFHYIITNGLFGLRHGSILYLEDREAINLITNLEDYNTTARINNTNRLILLTGNYDKLVVMPNFIYRVNGTTTITKIENPYNLQFLPIIFTTNRTATLTLPVGTGDPVTISNSYTNNEKLMIVSLQDSKFICGGRIKKTISTSDLYDENDPSDWTVTLHTAILNDNMLHLEFTITKKVASSSVAPITFKLPFRPLNATALNNDRGVNMFVRANGTIGGANNCVQNQATYCYTTFEIE